MTPHCLRRTLAFWALPAMLWLLAGSAAPVRADQESIVYSLEVACRQDRQAGLDLLQAAVSALPADVVGALRLERLDGAYCVRLGQAETAENLGQTLSRVKEHFSEAVPIRTTLEPARMVAKVDLAQAKAAPSPAPAGPPQARAEVAPAPKGAVPAVANGTSPVKQTLARTHGPATSVAAPVRLAAAEPKADKAPPAPAQGTAAKADAPAAPEKSAPPAKKPDTASPLIGIDWSDPLPFWFRLALAGLVLVVGLGVWGFWRRRQPAPQSVETEPGPEILEDPPCLSEEDERHLQNNLGELALAQGNLLSLTKGQHVKTIYITSCLNGEGKTQAAISLAHGLAINKARVLLVDGNPRAPVLSRRYRSSGVPGLSECLAEDAPPPMDMPRVTKYPNLHLMPFGGNGHGRPDLLKGNHLETFLKTYAANYDYIIMDGHSLTGSDTNIVACKFDGIIMAVQCCRTKWEMVRQASQKMTLMGGLVLGVILNRRQYYIPNFIYKSL